MQLIVGDKRVNVTVRAKGAMTVIIALKGEELHKAGLPSRYIEVRWVPSATCPLVVAEGRGQVGLQSVLIWLWCVLNDTMTHER